MLKKGYMTRLERWARWMLPHQEAEEVIADYRDIVGTPPRPEEELVRELGKPKDAIRPLTTAKAYRTWLAVFAVMTVCILAPGISGTTIIGAPLWIYLFDDWVDHPYGAYLAVLGAAAALVWFRWQGRKEKRLPRAVPILLAVFLVFIGWVLWFCWACSRDFDAFQNMWGTMKLWLAPSYYQVSRSVHLSMVAMGDGAAVIAFVGIFALVKARTGDRRWAAVYVLAVTAILAALLTLAWMNNMDLTYIAIEEVFREMLLQCAGISAVGLVGTGVALC